MNSFRKNYNEELGFQSAPPPTFTVNRITKTVRGLVAMIELSVILSEICQGLEPVNLG